MKQKFLHIAWPLIFFIPAVIVAQNNFNSPAITTAVEHSWNISLEETHKVFIENKGQFEGENNSKTSSSILYAANYNGVDIYFTPLGVTYRHDEIVKAAKIENRRGKRKRIKLKMKKKKKM